MRTSFVLLMMVAATISGCKKKEMPSNNNPQSNTETYDFNYNGDLLLTKPITFKADLSTPLVDSSITWDFGDGNSDTGNTVTHQFNSCKGFSVTMRVRGNTDTSVTKTLSVKLDATALSGKRRWNGTTGSPGGSFQVNEFEEEVKVLNDSMVSFRGAEFVMHGERYSDGTDIAKSVILKYKGATSLTYFFAADTFSYSDVTSPVGTNLSSGKKL